MLPLGVLAAPRETGVNTSHSEVQDIVDAIVRGEGSVNIQLAHARSLGKEAEVARRLEELSDRVSEAERLRNIALALVALKQSSGEATLTRMLDSRDPGTRMYAAQGLGQLRSRAVMPKLITLLNDKVPAVRREAARAVGRMHEKTAAAALLDAAKAESEPEARAAQLVAVGQVGGKKQVKALEEILAEAPSERTRRAAAHALCSLGEPAGFAYAKKMLASDDELDRYDALKLFEDSSAQDAAQVLEPLLAGKDLRLAAAAARTLYEGGNASMLEWLVVRSARATLEQRLIYEQQIETIGISDRDRKAILARRRIPLDP
jgi:HEAT repeat protein